MTTADKLVKILGEEIIPAEGCTEPIALAYAASLATKALAGKAPGKIDVYLSGNMIKNVKSVHIPGTAGEVGIGMAIAMGALLGDSSKKLMVISEIDASRLGEVRDYASAPGRITTILQKDCPKLYIRVEATLDEDKAIVEISNFHTHVSRYEINGRSLLKGSDKKCTESDALEKEEFTDRSFMSIGLICEEATKMPLERVETLFDEVICFNEAIAREGLSGNWGISIGKTIQEGIRDGVYGDDIKNNLSSWAAAGSDARMNGCPLPVMTTSGSGNQGMTCSLPIIRFCRMKGLSREQMIRGLMVSHLITIHIKENIGRLSAYCGAMAASAGVAGALAYIDNLGIEKVNMAVETTLATVSGIICDGAKSSCATKIATGIQTAVDSYYAAKKGRGLRYGDGIVGQNIESTISHVGTLGSDGMKETDDVILGIMLDQ